MNPLLQYSLKALIAVSPIVLLYFYYLRNFVFHQSAAERIRYLALGIFSSSICILLQFALPRFESDWYDAFVAAALVEEGVRFLMIYFRVRYSSANFTAIKGIFDSILLGLGFSFAENLHYALTSSGYVILLRCISSVPLHVIASGIMGYFVSYHYLLRADPHFLSRRRVALLWAFGIPYIIHAIFDFLLFSGGRSNYVVPLILIGGYLLLDYYVSRGRTLFGRDLLEVLEIDADESEIIERQRDYEKWINFTQAQEPARLSVFMRGWSRFSVVLMLGLCLFAGGTFFWLTDVREFMGMNQEILLSLLVLMPLAIATIIFITDKLNTLYIRQYLVRLPGGAMVSIRNDRLDLETISLDVHPRGIFINENDRMEVGDRLDVTFYQGSNRIRLPARVSFLNRGMNQLPQGALLQFTRLSARFIFFRWKFYFNKIWNRIKYNYRHVFRGRP
ncbi:MAG: PrsW family intramembrane metalloprotease [Spirochaetales bacterium]|nr:PrsW family intramembrane metalloprotease [Spirochaetales bacterium]